MKRTRTPDPYPSCSRERARRSPMPWFWMDELPHPIQRRGSKRCASCETSPISPPSPLHREERARCLESESAIDESIRMLTRSTMHPVRPGGTRTTDSSSPLAQPRPRFGGTKPGDACVRPLRRGSITATDGSSSAATHPIPHQRTSRSTIDPFNRREPSSPIHDTRPAARTPGALSSPHSFWTEGASARHLS